MTKTQHRIRCKKEIARLEHLCDTIYRDKRADNPGRPQDSTSRSALIMKIMDRSGYAFSNLMSHEEQKLFWRIDNVIRAYENNKYSRRDCVKRLAGLHNVSFNDFSQYDKRLYWRIEGLIRTYQKNKSAKARVRVA